MLPEFTNRNFTHRNSRNDDAWTFSDGLVCFLSCGFRRAGKIDLGSDPESRHGSSTRQGVRSDDYETWKKAEDLGTLSEPRSHSSLLISKR